MNNVIFFFYPTRKDSVNKNAFLNFFFFTGSGGLLQTTIASETQFQLQPRFPGVLLLCLAAKQRSLTSNCLSHPYLPG